MTRLHVLGFPAHVGGAGTELWHTLRLWRQHGAQVTITPTWRLDEEWAAKCREIGCKVVVSNPREFMPAPGVPVVSFCNTQLFSTMLHLDQRQNPVVRVPCMNYLNDREQRWYARGVLPRTIVCQSEYQRSCIEPKLLAYGMRSEQIVRIRGAFDVSDYPFCPKLPGHEFVVGRISRADPQKFRPDFWRVLEQVHRRIGRPLRVRVLGWQKGLAKAIGEPPPWAEVFGPGECDAREFMWSLDCLYQSGVTAENWPRVGLEAMALGVPIVTDDCGGWQEMARGVAYLVGSPSEAVEAICRVASEPQTGMVIAARRAVETRLGNDGLWGQWKALFEEVFDG
jgi:glycosyltransferase involved in cell wall biosynthesis